MTFGEQLLTMLSILVIIQRWAEEEINNVRERRRNRIAVAWNKLDHATRRAGESFCVRIWTETNSFAVKWWLYISGLEKT